MSAGDASTLVPDEEIGYLASEEYARVISPQPTGTSTSGQNPILRRGEEEAANLLKATASPPNTGIDGGDKEISIHLDPLAHRGGGGGEEEDSAALEEREHPILASDEVLKRSGAEFMSPAISPPLVPRRGSSIPSTRPQSIVPTGVVSFTDAVEDNDVEPIKLSGNEGRDPLLQPGEEAEPLFPDDDNEEVDTKSKASGSPSRSRDRARRPEMPGATGSHRFPSKDIWEEAPAHSQLQTTVSPRPPSHTETRDDGGEAANTVERTGACPEYVQGQPHDHYQPGDEKEFEQRHRDAKNKDGDYRHQVQSEGRDDNLDRLVNRGKKSDEAVSSGDRNGGAVRRFPSNDIWEDAPPSLQLSTTVTPSNDSRGEETAEPKGETTTTIGGTAGLGNAVIAENTRPTTGAPIEGPSALKPEIPGRPQVPSTRPVRKAPPSQPERETDPINSDKKPPPVLPDRPKPKVLIQPARPASTMARSPSTESPPTVRGDAAPGNPPPVSSKPKPAIPPRTAGIGGKIAALKAGFMSDLDQRLKLGPQAPKKLEKPAAEEVKEKEVLSDVRKNRARGPKGRKLPVAKEPENKPEAVRPDVGAAEMQVVGAWTVWSADEEGVRVNDEPAPAPSEVAPREPEPKPVVEEAKEDGAASIPSTAPLSEEPVVTQQTVPVVEKEEQVPTTSPVATADLQQEKAQPAAVIPESRDPEDPIETSGTSEDNAESKQGDIKNPEGVQGVEV